MVALPLDGRDARAAMKRLVNVAHEMQYPRDADRPLADRNGWIREELLEVVEPLQKIFWMHVEVGQVDRAPPVLPPVEVAVVPRGMMQLGHLANQIGPGGRAAKELARAGLHRALVLWEQAREPSGGLRLAHHGHQLAPGSRRQIIPGDERDHLMPRVIPCARGPQGTRQDNRRDGQDCCDDPHEDLHAAAVRQRSRPRRVGANPSSLGANVSWRRPRGRTEQRGWRCEGPASPAALRLARTRGVLGEGANEQMGPSHRSSRSRRG